MVDSSFILPPSSFSSGWLMVRIPSKTTAQRTHRRRPVHTALPNTRQRWHQVGERSNAERTYVSRPSGNNRISKERVPLTPGGPAEQSPAFAFPSPIPFQRALNTEHWSMAPC